MPNGTSRNTQNTIREAVLPSRTASVRFLASRSGSMSRMLFTMSTAQAMSPAITPPNHASWLTVLASMYVVPAVATSPKKTKTNTSPRP